MNGLSHRRPQDIDLRRAPSMPLPQHHPIFPGPRLAADSIGASRTQVPGCAAPEAAS
jgi:hypothetical protein